MTALKQQQLRKIAFYLRGFSEHFFVPDFYFRTRRSSWLNLASRNDVDELTRRVDYYNQLSEHFTLPQEAVQIGQIKKQKTTYYIDFQRLLRYFPRDVRTAVRFGDTIDVSDYPRFIKARPIDELNGNSLLLRLNSIRHFRPITDRLSYREKRDTLVWRGLVKPNHHRNKIFKEHFSNPLVDIGISKGDANTNHPEWRRPYLSIPEQLQHKFILSVEGNDVATNLKWIAQSNSLCFMTKPKFESWFMEGTLVAGKHYVQLRDDYADLPEKISYYLDHPDEAEAIIHQLQAHHEQFTDPKKEHLIGLLVVQKYLRLSGQLD